MDVNDVSNLLYQCRYCEKVSRNPDDIRSHINQSGDKAHRGKRAEEVEGLPYVTLKPDIETYPFDEWDAAIENYVDGADEVDVVTLSERLDVPTAYAAQKLRQDRVVPLKRNGDKWRGTTSWDDLTDKQQDTLLAWAYFPDKFHHELADMDYSGHAHQGTVSTTIRRYGWMFDCDDVSTPIEPVDDNGHEGKVETEKVDVETGLEALGLDKRDEVPDTEAAVADANHDDDDPELPPEENGKEFYEWLYRHIGRRAAEAVYLAGYESKDDLRAATIDELQEVPHVGEKLSRRILTVVDGDVREAASAAAEEPTDEEQGGATDDEVEVAVDEGAGPEEPALPAPTPGGDAPETGEDHLLYAPLGKERAWDAIKALIETGREEAAREVFEAVASGPIDLSPIEEDE